MLQRSNKRRGPEDVTARCLTSNLLTLGRDLRAAGLPIGSGQVKAHMVLHVSVSTGRIGKDSWVVTLISQSHSRGE